MLHEDAKDAIKRLASKVATKDSAYYFTQSVKSLASIASLSLKMRDWRMIYRALNELTSSFKLYIQYRDKKKICLFGSARTPKSDPDYKLAKAFSKAIVKKDFMVVTGAGPGIMQAGNEGAGTENSFGVNINLPFEQDANPFIAGDPKLITYKYFFIRKLIFIRETDATVLFPGGFGTLDEAYECLTLLQTGRAYPRPVVLMEPEGSTFWEDWMQFFYKSMLPKGLISPDDLRLLKRTSSIDEAVSYIENFYKVFHSIRYFDKGETSMRLERVLTDEELSYLNTHFKDILKGQKIVPTEPNAEEKKLKDFLRKPRILVPFNKINYGRLLDLIHSINDFDL